MSEHFENIKPWAEKLEQTTIADVSHSWQAMQALLDKEMPVAKNKDWKRWSLLIILLLLLIGVCNCPSIMRTGKIAENKLPISDPKLESEMKKNKTGSIVNSSGTKAMDSITINNGSKTGVKNIASEVGKKKITDSKTVHEDESSPSQKNNEHTIIPKTKTVSKDQFVTDPATGHSSENKNSVKKVIKKNDPTAQPDDNIQNAQPSFNEKNKNIKNANQAKPKNINEQKVSDLNDNDQNISSKKTNINEIKNTVTNVSPDPIKIKNADSIKTQLPTDQKLEKKSAATVVKKADDKKIKRIALVAGVGLNQFFTVGSQQRSNYNSSGTSGVLSDYIPVPMFRAYLNKKLYIQIEAQFNTPQYTKKLLAKEVTKTDTANSNTITDKNSVFVNKLFYFNIPLSIHYIPFKNFYAGAGIQFSRLTNAVGLFDDNKVTQGPAIADTLSDLKIASIKNDPVYKEIKTNEWRFLVDANYQWNNLVFGARYNQALSKFINVNVSGSQVTQARNSSIQLYVRYILWKNKTAKKLLSK